MMSYAIKVINAHINNNSETFISSWRKHEIVKNIDNHEICILNKKLNEDSN